MPVYYDHSVYLLHSILSNYQVTANKLFYCFQRVAWWISDIVLYSRSRGYWFEPHQSILCLVLIKPRKTCHHMTETLLTETFIKIQTKQIIDLQLVCLSILFCYFSHPMIYYKLLKWITTKLLLIEESNPCMDYFLQFLSHV